jgi:5-methylcytosine-specific restriction endonuclease McrA
MKTFKTALKKKVLKRDGFLCFYCGDKLDDRDATIDHKIPKIMGGTDEETNLVCCCGQCNSLKGNKIWSNT